MQAGQAFIPKQAALSLSPGGMQAVQVFNPRQVAELVTRLLVCKRSLVLGLPAGGLLPRALRRVCLSFYGSLHSW